MTEDVTITTWIAATVPIPLVVDGELVGVVASDVPIELVNGKPTAPLNLHTRPDVFRLWKADPSMRWGDR